MSFGGRDSYARYLSAVNAINASAIPGVPVTTMDTGKSRELRPSASPAIPLGPDDGVIEYVQQLYNSNPVLWGSLLLLVGLWAALKMKY